MERSELRAFRFAHWAIALVFVWFGGLKVIGLSPASPLVSALLASTMPFMPYDLFQVLFGLFEVLIGLMFIWPRHERVAVALLTFHMVTTVLPLAFLSSMTWSAPFVPTLEGQYIIKNIVIIALAAMILVDAGKVKKC
jgi:uncharacterized membrane protein YkgB